MYHIIISIVVYFLRVLKKNKSNFEMCFSQFPKKEVHNKSDMD